MNAAAIQHIWQAIQDSERSDDLQFMDDEFLIKVAAANLTHQRPEQSGVVGHELMASTTLSSNLPAPG